MQAGDDHDNSTKAKMIESLIWRFKCGSLFFRSNWDEFLTSGLKHNDNIYVKLSRGR